jgi:cytidylate kinase
MARQNMAKEALSLASKFEFTIIDGPPHAEEIARSCIIASDFVALPIEPSGLSTWASDLTVRQAIGALQHAFQQPPGLVADGRDMGTVVFIDAIVKIYLTASAEARAKRRYNQLKDKDIGVSLHALFQSIQARDERDMSREVAPLKPAEDAVIIDSTELNIEEVFDQVLAIVNEKLG